MLSSLASCPSLSALICRCRRVSSTPCLYRAKASERPDSKGTYVMFTVARKLRFPMVFARLLLIQLILLVVLGFCGTVFIVCQVCISKRDYGTGERRRDGSSLSTFRGGRIARWSCSQNWRRERVHVRSEDSWPADRRAVVLSRARSVIGRRDDGR